MAKVRDILGDDYELLKASGASDDRIKQLAQTKFNYYKEMKTLYKYDQVDDEGNIVEKKMDDVVDFMDEKDKAKANPNPKKVKTVDEIMGQTFLDRFNRTVDTNLANVANVARYVADKSAKQMGIEEHALKGNKKYAKNVTNFIEENRAKDEEYTKSQQSPIRQKESDKLALELSKAKGISQTATAGAKLLLDKASNPSEWNNAAILGSVLDPVNAIPFSIGAKAAAGASGLKKVAIGAGAGAVSGGVSGGGYEALSEKALGKSDEEAMKAGVVGGMAGVAMGGVFGGVGSAFSSSAKPKIKEAIKVKKIEAMSSEDINDKIYADASGKEVPDDVLDSLLDNELLQIDEVEASAVQAKPIIDEISTKAQTPDEINAMVAQYAPPTPKEISITMITNGQEVSPRFAGMRIRDALIKSIENPQRTPGEMYSVLINEGFSQERANVIVQSYTARDLAVFDDYTSAKISDIIDVEIVEKIKQLELKDERVRVEAKDGGGDAKQAQSGANADTLATRTEYGADTEQSTIPPSERGGNEVVRDDGLDTGQNGKAIGILSKDEGVDVYEATGDDSTALSRSGKDEVVSAENAVYTGGGLDLDAEKYKKGMFDLLDKNIEKLKNKIDSNKNLYSEYYKDPQKLTKAKHRLELYQQAKEQGVFNAPKMDDVTLARAVNEKPDKEKNNVRQDDDSVQKGRTTDTKNSGEDRKPTTKGERKSTNAKVDEIIEKPISEITENDKKILENYTGKGGLESGTKESLTQHYTDEKTVNAMYKALDDAGVEFRNALEPAVGSGNFLKGRKSAKWTTVDIDKTNNEVVKRLYKGDHQLSGYESFKPAEKFDLIISNVPFSEERGAGRLAYRPDVKALHDSFFIKALDDVKDDGVIAFITSKGVMDKANSKIRKEITASADVIGAYRLPDSAFKHTGTNVITDVIFLQKRPRGVESRKSEANRAFETTSKDDSGINMSDYYRQNPDNILGEMKAGIDPMYGKPAYLVTGESDLSKMKIDYEPYGVKPNQLGSTSDKISAVVPNSKVELLRKIKDTLDVELIKEYQQKYKKHPENDKGLKNYFADNLDDLYELGSYFDKSFKPAEIFYQAARYSGSGKIEITADSPIKERLIYAEDSKGVVDTTQFKEDIDTLLDQGYAYLGEGKIQNDVLFYSGNIYDKIDKMREITDRDISSQINTLEEFIPAKKSLEGMTFKGNEPWLLDSGIKIYKVEKTSKWVKVPGGNGERKVYEWKSEFGDTFDNHLNNRKLISEKKNESETAFKRRLREAESGVKDTLADIIQKAEMQRDEIEAVYNRKFNFYKSPDYKKLEYMIADALKELPKGFNLRETQKKFIIKSLYEGKGINAHDVGGGKTFAGIVLGRVLKQKGIAKKPLYVVPSKVIKNWQKEILQLYPKAKIVNLGNLNKTTRTKKLFALANENADFVLISQEGFKELKLPNDVESKYARELLNEHQSSDDLKGRALALQQERIKMYLEVLAKSNSDKRVTIDKLGIDAIIADEARAFKNIGVKSSLARLGLGKPFGLKADETSITLQSALAYDFRFKTRYISERNNNSNIYMLDATPTPNKPLELFTMLKHLDNRVFDEYNIKTDEDFVGQFLETGLIQNKDGKFKDGIVGIKNVFELRSIMDRFIDRISMKEFKDKGYIDIPEGKVYKHIIESSDENDIVFSDIQERLAEAKGDKEKRKDVLGIFSNGVNASVDPRLYAKEAISELAYRTPENNKISKVIDLVAKRRKSDKKAGQIIFVDNAGHSMQHLDTNMHQEIKTKLLGQGYKKEEIAIISGQEITNVKTGVEQKASGNRGSEMKQDIVDAYDAGKIKIVIGTTKSAGEGMNIQKYTTDIYHLDLPWTPAEITQRNGRGVRYGNNNKEVNIHYFFTQGSFDDLMFNTITKKQGWNDLIWDAKAKSNLKIADSEGGGLPSADEIVLAMEKDPVKRKELKLRAEYDRLNENFANIEDEVRYQKGRMAGTNADISDLQKRINKAENEIKTGDINTKELMDLFMKSKKSSLHKKKYDEKLKSAIDSRKKILERNKERLGKLLRVKEQIKADLGVAKGDLFEGQNKLERFEMDNLDEGGRFKVLEEC